MLNRKIIFPIVAAALVTASIIFGISHVRAQGNNPVAELFRKVVQKLQLDKIETRITTGL